MYIWLVAAVCLAPGVASAQSGDETPDGGVETAVEPSSAESAPTEAAIDDTSGVAIEDAETTGEAEGFRWDIESEYRLWIEGLTGFPIADGRTLDDVTRGEQVLELGGSVGYDWFEAKAAVRIASGALFGAPPCDTDSPDCTEGPGGDAIQRTFLLTEGDGEASDWIVPRELWVQFLTPIGLLRIGHMESGWGSNIVAASGSDRPDDDRSPLDQFNDRKHGDLVERILFVTRPALAADGVSADDFAARIVVGLAGDIVYHDELASLVDGDLAAQAIGILALRPEQVATWDEAPDGIDWDIGTYFVYRNQEDDDGDTLEAFVIDFAGKIRSQLPISGLVGSLAFEAAWILGETTRVETEATGPAQAVSVESFGLATEAVLQLQDQGIDLGLRAAWASGDANPDDDTLFRFTFDRDFKAGLILFDYVIPEITAASRDTAIDPSRIAVPPKGIEEFPIDPGAIAGVAFLNPVVMIEVIDGFHIGLASVFARATAPLIDPTETFARGGAPTNAFGGDAEERGLGVEFDAMLRYRFAVAEWLMLEARAEYGVFLFGGAFANARGDRPAPIHYGAGRIGLYF